MSKHVISLDIDNNSDKVKTSLFLLTINSNKAVMDKKEPFIKEFKAKIKDILENIPNYIKTVNHAVPDPNMIINIKTFVEIGKKQHRLHCHCIVEVKHNSLIQLDSQKITKDSGYYVNVQFMKSSNDLNKILSYIRKSI